MQLSIACLFASALAFGPNLQAQPQSPVPVAAEAQKPRIPFVKKWNLDAFGYDLAPLPSSTFPGQALTNGPFIAHGLECPYCNITPSLLRSRPLRQPFGVVASYRPLNGRAELFVGIGAVPDGPLRVRRGTLPKDAWLYQAQAGASVAVDRNEHVRLGILGRYLHQTDTLSGDRRHWNTIGGSATFSFGR